MAPFNAKVSGLRAEVERLLSKPTLYLINREGWWTVIEEKEVLGKTSWTDVRLATEDDKYNIPRHPVYGEQQILGDKPEGIN